MKTSLRAVSLVVMSAGLLLACDEDKKGLEAKGAPSATTTATAVASAPPIVPTASAAPTATAPAKRDIKCEPGDTITFNQPGLEAEIRKKSGKDAGPITKADLAKVKSINLTQVQVDFLDPCVFPHLTNVHDIFLGQGDLDDLKPLESLTQLVSLRAAINKVKDIKPLSRMTKLDRLDLARTQVEDLTPVGNMTELTELALDDAPVADLTPLAKCTKLERLSIKNTRVSDLKPLQTLRKLKVLSIQGSPITDTNVLAGLKGSGLKIETK